MEVIGDGAVPMDELGRLASAALDCELTRAERVRFFELLLVSPEARAELERLLRLEGELREVASARAMSGPSAGFDAAVAARIAAAGLPEHADGAGPGGAVSDEGSRFRVHPIGHSSPSDRLAWEDYGEIAPGETRRIHIRKPSEGAYHFRIRSAEPAEVEIQHLHHRGRRLAAHRARVHGVHYASLERPRTDEVLVVTNTGSHPVGIEVSAGQRDAVRVA